MTIPAKSIIQPLSLLVLLLLSVSAMALPAVTADLPAGTRTWENRSNQAGSDYQNIEGADIAYVDQEGGGWYFRDANGQWRLFHQGEKLDLGGSYDAKIEALGYEVVSGTAFFDNGSAGDYQMQLIGPSGELRTKDGVQFNPHQFELLKGAKQKRAYFNVVTEQWSPASAELMAPLSRPIAAPYQPLYLRPDLVPAQPATSAENLTFDTQTLRYLNSNGSIAAFHPHIANNFRRWNNQTDMPCSDYAGYEGKDVIYVNGVWYHVYAEAEFRPFFEGRYLDFSDQHDHEFLEVSLTINTQVGSDGDLQQQNILLDGETGQLVDDSLQPVDPNTYNAPTDEQQACDISYSINLNDSLFFEGVEGLRSPALSIAGGLASEQPFRPSKREVTLLQVVPMQNIDNDPFNERTLPITINKARTITTIVAPSPGPGPGPGPGSCPLNTSLTMVAALPESAPLGNYIGVNSAGTQLNAGLTVNPADQAIAIANPMNLTQGVVSMAAGFTYVSGSALGTVTEGTNLTYIVRRTSDSAEFEISFTFSSEIVFDDPGIVINSLSGKLCVAGGPG